MNRVHVKARAKINLTLDVLGKRPDGYHELQTILQTVSLHDSLLLERIEKPKTVLRTDLRYLPTDDRNLAYAAAERLRLMYGLPGGVFIQLTKRIPVAAGLAGGSTDAAAVLLGMDRLYELGLSTEELCAHGAALGSDVPFCIRGGTMLGEGVGERLMRLAPCPDFFVVLAKPAVSVSTAFVYKNLNMQEVIRRPDTPGMQAALTAGNAEAVAAGLCNVLESVTMPLCPVLEQIRWILLENGAAGALMSGSGPTMFGLFFRLAQARGAAAVLRRELRLEQVFVTGICQARTKD